MQICKLCFGKDVENIASKHIFARWQSILVFLILKLSILKEAKILSLTSSPVNFCRTKMTGKNSKKASSSSRIPPNKLLDVKLELITPSQLVKYDPHQITQINSPNKPSSSRMVPLGKLVQSTSSAKALFNDYDPFKKKKNWSLPLQ